MTDHKAPAFSEKDVLTLLIEPALHPDVAEKLFFPLLHHLADLKVVGKKDEGQWEVAGFSGSSPEAEDTGRFRILLIDLCRSERGFAIKFFLKDLPEEIALTAQDPEGFKGHLSDGLVGEEGQVLPRSSSNLSNLQIVKKVGRQLSPLIELETWYLKHLEGVHTTRQEARHLFNFILGRIKPKQEPRAWEQLSRRRHKK